MPADADNLSLDPNEQPSFFIPIGTHVVARVAIPDTAEHPSYPAGAVAVIVAQPLDAAHAYRVRFPDGAEVALGRHQLAIRKHTQPEDFAGLREVATPLGEADLLTGEGLAQHIIFRCIVGSRAYGLDTEASDVDRRGIYLPPAEQHWSLYGVPEQLENAATQECYWELQKFLGMALKANPNVLECLYTPLVELATPLAQDLLAMRAAFLSTLIYQTYNGYALSQFRKLEQDLRATGAIRWKHAMHLIRLLLAGIATLREGAVPVRVEDAYRERLLAIRRGEVQWAEVDVWRLALHHEFDAAFTATRLPERPDYAAANAFLLRARRSMVGESALSAGGQVSRHRGEAG
jgi:predicted nucleotidyltransferase